jgi:hypothetical protein
MPTALDHDLPPCLACVSTDRDGTTSPLIAYADVAPFLIVPLALIGTGYVSSERGWSAPLELDSFMQRF